MADTLNLPSLKSRHRVHGDANVAILSGRKAHLDKSPSATADSFVDLSAKTAVPDFRAVLSNNLSVEPGRTIAGNLPVEADGRERPYSQPVAARHKLRTRLQLARRLGAGGFQQDDARYILWVLSCEHLHVEAAQRMPDQNIGRADVGRREQHMPASSSPRATMCRMPCAIFRRRAPASSGASIWSSPTIDAKRLVLYAGTGDNHSAPATSTRDAVLALS